MQIKLLVFFVAALFVAGCNSPFTAKPTGYFKINFPDRSYRTFDDPGYPYTFDYPAYARVVKDTSLFDTENPYWINIDFPASTENFYQLQKDGGFFHL